MMAENGVSWPRAVFTCLTVLSLYIGGCQAAVGDACPVGNECTVTGETCSGGTCVCDTTTHYQSGSVCVTKVAAGLSCAGLPTDACSTNSACVSNICTCNSGFYDSDGPAGSSGTCVSQIALSGTCDNSLGVTVIQCSTSEAVCGTDNKCRCGTGTFDDNGFDTTGGVCRNMNLLMVTAVTSTNLGITSVTISWTAPVTYSGQVNRYEVTWTSAGGGQTASTATSVEVTGLQSATQYTFTVNTIESGSQMSEQQVSSPALVITTKSQLGDTCGVCADSNAICSSTTCVCNTGYYDNNGDSAGGTCIQIINAGEGPCYNIAYECTANSACSGDGGTCVCNSGFYDSGNTCASKIALSVSCNSALTGVSQCSDVNAECTSTGGDACRCMAGYFDSNGFSSTGGTCTAMSTLKVTGVTVTAGTDTVSVTWTPPTEASQVNKYQVMWSPPKTDGSTSFDAGTALTATISGFTSGATYIFSLKTVESGSRPTTQEIESDSRLTVSMKAALSVTCGTGSPVVECADTTTASCILNNSPSTNVCRCNDKFFDSNGFGSSGGVCTPMSNLKVTAVSSSSVTTTGVTISWTAPLLSSQVSRYTVVWSDSNSETGTYPAGKATGAVITGLTQRTTYVFKVKSLETGSRSTTQEIESDSSVTVTTMSLGPSTLVVSQVQSRQFTLNWTKPTITNGHLWGYRLTVLDGSTCVQEVIFTCTTCPGYMAFSFICQEGFKQTKMILPADLDRYTYTVGNLLPYINYTASVVAVTAAGDGHPNTQYAMTDQEVPQHPTTLTATVVSSTEINVNWDITDPKPGPTTYTLYIIAVAPESSRTQTIPGFSVRSYKMVGLQEYRTYTFNLTASTVKGLAVFQQTLPSAKTLAAAPGAVGNFMVARPDGPDYTTVRVSWELPAVLERNSDIVKFMFTHNTTGGNLNAVPEEVPIDTNLNTVIRNLAVLPHNTYYIEVYAVGTNSNGDVYNGIKSINTYMAPAGRSHCGSVHRSTVHQCHSLLYAASDRHTQLFKKRFLMGWYTLDGCHCYVQVDPRLI